MENVGLRPVLLRCVRAHALAEPVGSVEDGVRRAAGVYGATPTCYLSVAVRVRGFEPDRLQTALLSRRSLVRIPAMRGSVYILPRDLVPSGLAMARSSGGARWQLPALRRGGLGEAAISKLTARIESLLHEGPMTAAEIRKGLDGWKDPFPQALSLLLRHLSIEGRIVSTRAQGGWKSQLYEYALLREWIDLPLRLPTLETALANLAPMYFDANGPETLANFAWWAGVTPAIAKQVLDMIGLKAVSVEGLEAVHFATKRSLDELTQDDAESVVNLVPHWDTYLMAQNDRRRYLDERWAKYLVDPRGNVTKAILKDGRVVGVWDFVGDTLRFAPFERVLIEEVRAAADCLEAILHFRTVRKVRLPASLEVGGQNRFLSPLT